MLVYAEARNYAREARLNVDYSEQLEQRTDFFSAYHFALGPLSTETEAEILAEFPERPTEAEINSVWSFFLRIKSFCREYAAEYEVAKKNFPSGTYRDTSYLKELWMQITCKQIDVNASKSVSVYIFICKSNIFIIHEHVYSFLKIMQNIRDSTRMHLQKKFGII